MKKARYSTYFLLLVCTILLTGLTTCKNDDNNSSSSNVELLSFGPCPIPRGAALRIIGRNMDKVQSVGIQGCDPITDIIKISASEINVTVPKTAENGKITLNVGNQDPITSITDLTVEGVINLTGFSPTTAKAGDILTLTGEDLDFVNQVVFPNGIQVVKDSFVNYAITSIQVKVPLEAQTGKLAVSNGAADPILAYFDDDLNVVLPTITSFSQDTIRAGSVLTITGKDLDLVKSITFGGTKLADSFTLSSDNTTITVTVPVDAQDGAIVLTAFSGVKVTSETDLIMTVPTITSVAPTSVYANDTITIDGTDLDLVSAVAFGGGKQPGQIVADGRTPAEIKVVVPGNAKDGTVVLTTLANKTVTSEESLTIQVQGGSTETVIFQGPVTLSWGDGGRAVVAASDLANVPAGSILTIYFTQTDNWGQAQINDGNWTPIAAFGGGTITTDTYKDKTATSQDFALTQDMLDMLQANAGIYGYYSTTDPAAIIIQGSDWIIDKITVKVPSSEKVLWSGSLVVNDWAASYAPVDPSSLTAGQTLGVDFTCDPSASYWQLEVMVGSWWTDFENWPALFGTNQPHFTGSETNLEFAITQTDIDGISAEGSALNFAGNGIIINKVYVK